MKLSKKHLVSAGFLAGVFLVMNVGMHFFLRASQPKIGKRLEQTPIVHHDSLNVASDSAGVVPDAVPKTAPPADNQLQVMTGNTDAIEPAGAASSRDSETVPGDIGSETLLTEDLQGLPANEGHTDDDAPNESNPTTNEETAKLGKLLESMKPDEAASIITHLSTEQIIALLMRMKERNAAKIMAALPVEQAARVATIMSGLAERGMRRQ